MGIVDMRLAGAGVAAGQFFLVGMGKKVVRLPRRECRDETEEQKPVADDFGKIVFHEGEGIFFSKKSEAEFDRRGKKMTGCGYL